MKNFDEERAARAAGRDRSFTLGGETFSYRETVRPEVIGAYQGMADSTPLLDVMRITDEVVLSFLDPADDAHARWKALRARDDDAVGVQDLLELVKWLVEEQTARPTEQPSGSGTSPTTSGTTSTDGSSSLAVPEEQTASI